MTQTAQTWFLRQWRDGVVTGIRVQAVWTWPWLPHLPSMCSPDIPEEGNATSILHTGKDDFVWNKLWICMKNASSTSLSWFCQHLLWPRAALFPHKILTELLQPLFSIVLVHLWKGHKPSYTEYRYFKGKGNLDFSTMGILTCTACQ